MTGCVKKAHPVISFLHTLHYFTMTFFTVPSLMRNESDCCHAVRYGNGSQTATTYVFTTRCVPICFD